MEHEALRVFKQEGAADSVNPSLWRQAQLNTIHGLFKATARVYQVRGFDISNMTIVEGNTGLIVIDTLASPDTARAALDLYYQYRPKKPVGTVIYSHSHPDHFGGAKGVTSEADVASGRVQLLAPAGFNEAIAGEIVLAGTAMGRRAQYQFGVSLPPGPVVMSTAESARRSAARRSAWSLPPPWSSVTRRARSTPCRSRSTWLPARRRRPRC